MEKVILPDSPSFVDLCTHHAHQHAMRYYRLWIYACNTVLAIATLIFTVFAVSVCVDPRLKLLSGVEFYQPTFLYAYVALLLQCGVLQAIGCLGALRLNQKLLNTYWTLLLVLMIGDIIVGLVWAFRLDRIKSSLRPSLRHKFITQYKIDPEFTQVWDWIQSQDMCCGVDSPFDFPQFNESFSQYINLENQQHFHEMTVSPVLPSTCCTITKWDSTSTFSSMFEPPTRHTNNYANTFPHFIRGAHMSSHNPHHHSSPSGASFSSGSNSKEFSNKRHQHSTNYHTRGKSSSSSTESEQIIYGGRRKGPVPAGRKSMELKDDEIPPEQMLLLFTRQRQKRDEQPSQQQKQPTNTFNNEDYYYYSDELDNDNALKSQLTQPSSSTTTISPSSNNNGTVTITTVTKSPGRLLFPIPAAVRQIVPTTTKPATPTAKTTTEHFSSSRNNNNNNVINSICVLPQDFTSSTTTTTTASPKSSSTSEDGYPHSKPISPTIINPTTSSPLDYYHVHQHYVGCADKILEWVDHVTDILFVLGFCIIVFLKGCFLAILRYEIKEMIQKIHLLNGDEAVRTAAMNELLGLTSIYGTDENTSQDEDYEDDDDDDENVVDGQGLVRLKGKRRKKHGADGPRESSTTTTTTATTTTTVMLNNENGNNNGGNGGNKSSNKNDSSNSSVGTKPQIENHIGNKPAVANNTKSSISNSNNSSSNPNNNSSRKSGGGATTIEEDFDSASALLESTAADDNTNKRGGRNCSSSGPPNRSNYIPVPRNGNNNNTIVPTRHQHQHQQASTSLTDETTNIAMVNFSRNRNELNPTAAASNTSSSVTTSIQ